MPFAIAQLLRRSSLLILVLLLVVVVPCSHLVRRSNPSLTGSRPSPSRLQVKIWFQVGAADVLIRVSDC